MSVEITPGAERAMLLGAARVAEALAVAETPAFAWRSLLRRTASWLRSVADLHEPPDHPPGCQWCSDEDWPCADVREALAVAQELFDRAENEVSVPDKTRRAEEHLRRLVVENRLGPDRRLPSERALAENLSVPRATVRLIVARLITQGLIERTGDGGYASLHPSNNEDDSLPASTPRIYFDVQRLYERLDRARTERLISWAQLCSEAGVNKSVTSRMAYGREPNPDNLLRLLLWLGDTDVSTYARSEPENP